MSTDACNATIYQGNLGENLLCGTVLGSENLCQKNSGSSLICNNNLAGLLSFGTECCDPRSNLGMYVDISKYNTWIDEVFRSVVNHDDASEEDDKISPTTESYKGSFYFEDPSNKKKHQKPSGFKTSTTSYKPTIRPINSIPIENDRANIPRLLIKIILFA